jgi:hypothetical protein
MSTCPECNSAIEDSHRILETPCCGIKYHSACAIQKLGMALSHFATIYCECQQLLYEHPQYAPQDQTAIAQRIAAVKAKPGVPEEVKKLKTKTTLLRKSLVVYQKYLKEKKAAFHELVDSQVEAVKLAKAVAQTEIKESEPFRTYRRLQTGLNTQSDHFMKKHELSRYEMKEMIGSPYGRRWGPWAFRPLHLMSRGFRIRI